MDPDLSPLAGTPLFFNSKYPIKCAHTGKCTNLLYSWHDVLISSQLYSRSFLYSTLPLYSTLLLNSLTLLLSTLLLVLPLLSTLLVSQLTLIGPRSIRFQIYSLLLRFSNRPVRWCGKGSGGAGSSSGGASAAGSNADFGYITEQLNGGNGATVI